jgi:hypothetical protein
LERWDKEYIAKSGTFATCRFLRQIGNEYLHPEIGRVVKLHDEITNAYSDLELA